MTTPDEPKIDMEPGDEVSKAILDKFGVKNPEDLDEIARKHKSRVFYDRRHEEKVEQLQQKVDELQTQLQDREDREDFGNITDPTIKSLKREIRDLREAQTQIIMRYSVTDEDREMEPFIAEAREKYPEIAKSVKDPLRRLDAYREIARSLRSAAETSANTGADKHRRDSATRVGLTAGGAPVSARASSSDEDLLAKFKTELANAKNMAEKDAVKAKYEKKYPHLFT